MRIDTSSHLQILKMGFFSFKKKINKQSIHYVSLKAKLYFTNNYEFFQMILLEKNNFIALTL